MRIKLFTIKYLPLIISLLFHYLIFSFFIQKKEEFSESINNYQQKLDRLIPLKIKSKEQPHLLKNAKSIKESKEITGKSQPIPQTNLPYSLPTAPIDLDQNPKLMTSLFLQMNLPTYPLIARSNELEGTVLVEIEFNESGKVQKILLINSSGHTSLDNSVLNTVKEWQIKPAIKAIKLRKKFEFKLN